MWLYFLLIILHMYVSFLHAHHNTFHLKTFTTTETQLHAQVNPTLICGGRGTGTGFSSSSSVFSYQYNSTMALHAHISPGT
jgi:hypothetical protein